MGYSFQFQEANQLQQLPSSHPQQVGGRPSNLLWTPPASAFVWVPTIPQPEWGEGAPLPWMHVRALSVQTDRLAVLDHGPFQGQRLRVGSGHVEQALTPHPLSPFSRPAVPRISASSMRRTRRWSPREFPSPGGRPLPASSLPRPGCPVNAVFCAPSIPRETSAPLRQLLLALLQRNHKDRMDFGECQPPGPPTPERPGGRALLALGPAPLILHSQLPGPL